LPRSRGPRGANPGGLVFVGLVLCGLALLFAARGLARHNTWYLASDQFAFLTFADDLLAGRIFHDTTTIRTLAGSRVQPDVAVDAYFQTYIWEGGRLFSRYPPGFPALLALAKAIGGEAAEHWLNPALYLLLLLLLARLAARLCPHGREAAVATSAVTVWALLVIPVEVHYWGITVARDLPAHLLGLAALLAGLEGRAGLAGLGLGFAASIRPDAVLWGVSVGAVMPAGRRGLRDATRGAAGFLLGALPLFAYNTVTQGNPLAFTQGSEFRWLFVANPTAVAATFLPVSLVSGGGFRLANFSSTFPAHVHYVVGGFGAFLVLAVGMLAYACVHGRMLGRALGPYAIVAFLFYSCWGHGDPRYLVGVSLCLMLLVAAGVTELVRALSDDGAALRRRIIVVVAVVVVALASAMLLPRDPERGLTALERTVAGALVVAAWLASRPWGRGLATIVPALAFALFGATRIMASSGTPDPFQHDQVERARSTFDALVPAGALVFTSPSLGRPAENISHYTHADAAYLGELRLLLSDADNVALRCTALGRPLYLLLAVGEPLPFTAPRDWWSAREVARRDGEALRDWFVDPYRATAGAVLYEATMKPIFPRS
jgi:hypothetical protein